MLVAYLVYFWKWDRSKISVVLEALIYSVLSISNNFMNKEYHGAFSNRADHLESVRLKCDAKAFILVSYVVLLLWTSVRI